MRDATAAGPAPPGTTPAQAPIRKQRFTQIEAYRAVVALVIAEKHLWENLRTHDQRYPLQDGHHLYQRLLYAFNVPNPLLVSFFFVISASLVSRSWMRQAVGAAAPEAADRPGGYLFHRVVRSLPAYWLVVLVVWASRNNHFPGDWLDLVEHMTLTQTLDSHRVFYTLGSGWSLSVQFMFDILVAFGGFALVRACRRLATREARVRLIAASIGAMVALGLFYKWYVFVHLRVSGTSFSYSYSLPDYLDVLGFGLGLGLVVVLREGRAPLSRRTGTILRSLGMAGAVCTWPLYFQGTLGRAYFNTFLAASLVLVVLAVYLAQPPAHHLGNVRWLRWTGRLGLGIYLLNQPVMETLHLWGLLGTRFSDLWIDCAYVLPLTVLLAWVVHHVIERPALELRHLVDRRGRGVDLYAAQVAALPTPPVADDHRGGVPARAHLRDTGDDWPGHADVVTRLSHGGNRSVTTRS